MIGQFRGKRLFGGRLFAGRLFGPQRVSLPPESVGGATRRADYIPWYRDRPPEVDRLAQLREEDDIAVALVQVIYAAGYFD
jgi:hypothetical protein